MYWGIILTLRHIAPRSQSHANRIFSFDFDMFCGILSLGRTQAAGFSHQKVASSTFSIIKTTKVIRAFCFDILTFAAWPRPLFGRGLQTPIDAQFFCAAQFVKKFGRTQKAELVASALFHVLHLGRRVLCGISGSLLTARICRTADTLATRPVCPMIQKVRIC